MDCPGLYACVSAAHNVCIEDEYHIYILYIYGVCLHNVCDAYESIRDRHRPLSVCLLDQCSSLIITHSLTH
jgi:hypothetical protein